MRYRRYQYILSIILCFMLLFNFTACNKSKKAMIEGSPFVVPTEEVKPEISFLLPNIAVRYPNKKVLVWLMDEYALKNMTESWLIAFNDKLIEKGSDFVLQMKKIPSLEMKYYDGIKSYIQDGNQADLLYTGNLMNSGTVGGMTDSYMYAYKNDLLMPLDDYLKSDTGQIIYKLFDDKYWKSVSIQGKIYGLRIDPYLGETSVISVNNEILNKYGLSEENVTKELSSLLPFLNQISNVQYPIEFNYDLQSIMEYLGYQFIELPIALEADRGCFNIFEDSDFVKYLKELRTFYDQGYIDPDTQGKLWTAPIFTPLTGLPNNIAAYNTSCTNLAIAPFNVDTETVAVGISKTSQYPKECITLLSWLYSDRELADLLVYGVEGVDYLREDGRITAVKGGSINPFLSYYTGLEAFTTAKSTDIENKHESYAQYNKAAELTPLTGFHFNDLGWEDKIYNLNTIIEKYTVLTETDKDDETKNVTVRRTFLTGHDANIDSTLKTLNQELKEAGINELIDEVNRQYEQWKDITQ